MHFESGVRMGIGTFNLVRIQLRLQLSYITIIIYIYILFYRKYFYFFNYILFQMISLLPARIIKLLEFIGFSGDKVIRKIA